MADCSCGAVDVVGASHLPYCPSSADYKDLVRSVMRVLPTYGDGDREWTQAEDVIRVWPNLHAALAVIGESESAGRKGAECICWKENENIPARANESICPKHRGNVDVPTAWEMLRLAAGYFQAIEEQLRPLLEREHTPDEFRTSAYGVAMETAANIAKHQRANIEREGVEAARIQVSVMAGDMRGENALAWLAGTVPAPQPEEENDVRP